MGLVKSHIERFESILLKVISREQPTRVAVIPPTPAFNGNALFESRRLDSGAHSPNTHWLDCYAALRERGRDQNILFDTADVISLDDADALIYMAQPESPRDVAANKCKHPQLKMVLLMTETSLGCRWAANPKNHTVYDAIVTYIEPLVDDTRYFFLPPRAYFRERIKSGLPFNRRRMACLVGTNRKMTYRTGIMAMRKGWTFSLRDWIDYVFCPGELMSFRSEVGKMCAEYRERGFDLFGEGWELLRETRDFCNGIPATSALEYIGNYRYYFALENHSGPQSLISERIWDALWGDAVPVYRGNTGLNKFVPPECYIDATRFQSTRELFEYLCALPEHDWERYRSAGRDFIHSTRGGEFLPDAFAERFLGYMMAVVSPKPEACLAR